MRDSDIGNGILSKKAAIRIPGPVIIMSSGGRQERPMTIESAVYVLGVSLVLALTWQTQHVIRKRLSQIQNELSELQNLASRLFVMALNARAAEPAAAEASLTSSERGVAVGDNMRAPPPELEGELANVDELCAKLITLVPPKEALPLLSKQEVEERAIKARERLQRPLQGNEVEQVRSVRPTAAAAAIQVGDVLTTINVVPVMRSRDAAANISVGAPGSMVAGNCVNGRALSINEALRSMSNSGTKVEATIAELVAAFPVAFTLDPKLVRPVKLGIKDDLYGQSALSHRRITAALRAYCNSVHYLEACAEGSVRIDLAGEPAGTVTAAEAHHAREGLAALATAASTRKVASSPTKASRTGQPSRPPESAAPKESKTGKRTPTAEAASPGRKRLSLSDLKRAAPAKKAAVH
jgi:ProP effector